MQVKESLKKLKESKVFSQWKEKNPDNFFSYALKIFEAKSEEPWQLGFYLKSRDKMTSFIIKPGGIEMQNEEEVFKKPGMEVKPIDIEKIEFDLREILGKANDFQKEKYSKELMSKTIAILQNLENYGEIWNLTFITHSFRALNIKMSAETGKVMYHHLESLMDYAEK